MSDIDEPISLPPSADPETIGELLDRIVQKHHAYTRSAIGRIADLLKRISSDKVDDFTAYLPLREAVMILANDLLAHLQKEESVLFPYIGQLDATAAKAIPISRPVFGSVTNPVRMMRLEHEETDNVLRRIRQLTNEYTPAGTASPEIRDLYQSMRELETDLREHIRLEEDLLFPQAARLENDAFGGDRPS
jgi:regulator of cell morphogenesis and NO signaling